MDPRPDSLTPDASRALARLSLGRQTALEHAARRGILRQLHREGRPISTVDLAADGQPLSAVSYHARVLRGCGLIDTAKPQQARDTVRPCFVSTVCEDRGICSLLAATEASDGGP